ncbi:MAG: tRNA 4-thiouridine(8) synthase ThiI, partial [Clostridia bacterium]|nr:tRNA 4-thiouridine(8) synthase ThiI [Clostridia bacterium]
VRERAYVSCATLPGPGGLPLGASGRAHLLLSGGIDSPVAGWLAMKRGLEVEAVHFHSFPFTSERSLEKVVDLCRVLARYAGVMTLHVVPFTAIQRAIYAEVPPALGITVMRRMMFRLAEAIARQRRGEALVTGESLGQVASQTLASIAVIGAVVELPILRPLIAFDKVEITDWARRIDTYPISIRPYEDCCTVFVPRHPSTRPRLEAVAAAEARLDVAALTAEALAGVETSEVTA